MTNYVQHLGLTAWRKKSALLIAIGLLSLIIFGLQYIRINDKPVIKDNSENPARIIALDQSFNDNTNIKFISGNKISTETSTKINDFERINVDDLRKLEQPSRDEISAGKQQADNTRLETDQELGIPFVNLDMKNIYIPKRRLVHLDLKGAPPLLSFFPKFFSLIRNLGATGILIEYEDMFPYSGILKNIAAKNAYTPQQIREILQQAEKYNLEVIPLVQTFGHVEFALKHAQWSRLREVEGSPQALCPSRNESLDFIKEMVSQVMELHPNIKYLHIGCDEVFQMGECEICRLELHENLFLRHVKKVATNILKTYPHLRIIIWDDMLRHVSQQSMLEFDLGNIVEPMVWVYAEDIYRFVQPQVWDKYVTVFKTAWTASAFKGAFGETLYVPDSKRHLENNLRWLDVMSQQSINFKHGLRGLVLTGWQRYDHFAVLCELLPAGIPSLALSLTAVTHGYFNSSLKSVFLSSLNCPKPSAGKHSPFINLNTDPFLWDKLGRCMFVGSSFFRLTYRIHTMENEVLDYVKTIRRDKGWMTDYNIKRNYSLPLRVDELTSDYPRTYHGTVALIRGAVDSMIEIFDSYTIGEWIEQRIYPYVVQLETIENQSIALKSVNHWPARPLPPLKRLEKFGVPMPNN